MGIRVIRIGSIVLIALLAACSTVIGGVAKVISIGMFPSSDFLVVQASVSDYEKQEEIFRKNSGRLIIEKNLTHYFEENKDGSISVSHFVNSEFAAINDAMTKGVGLLMPILIFNEKGRLVADWGMTANLHRNLVNNMRVRMADLSLSRKIWLEMQATSQIAVARGGFLHSNNKRFNNETYDLVLKKHEGNFDYIVFDVAFDDFGLHVKEGDQISMIGDTFLDRNYFKFVSMEYFRGLRAGGSYRIHSACGLWYPEESKDYFRSVEKGRAKPVSNYPEFLKKVAYRKGVALNSCKASLHANGFSGYMRSEKIR